MRKGLRTVPKSLFGQLEKDVEVLLSMEKLNFIGSESVFTEGTKSGWYCFG